MNHCIHKSPGFSSQLGKCAKNRQISLDLQLYKLLREGKGALVSVSGLSVTAWQATQSQIQYQSERPGCSIMTLFVKTRICHFQVDEGGIKALLENSWTTFMKARVMCGAGNTQQQYNNMKQAVVLTAQDKRAGVMYGLFSNAW